MVGEPEPVGGRSGRRHDIADRDSSLERFGEEREDALEYRVEHFARIDAVLETAVQDEAQTRVEIGPFTIARQDKPPHHEADHAHQGRARCRQRHELLQRRIALTPDLLQDFSIKELL